MTGVQMKCPSMVVEPTVFVLPLDSTPSHKDDILSDIILSVYDHDRASSVSSGKNELKLLIVAERSRQSFSSSNDTFDRGSIAALIEDSAIAGGNTRRTWLFR